jgi:hypothetical protein
MAEKVEKLGLHREKDFMYYVKDASVWKVQRKQPHVPKGRPEKVAPGSFKMDSEFIYFVDRDGDVSRAKRAVGGQKRKKTVINPPGLITRKTKAKSSKSPASRVAKTRPAAQVKRPSTKPTTRAAKGKAQVARTGKTAKTPSRAAKGSSRFSKGAKAGKGKGRK